MNALVLVDVQNDFLPGGSLPVPGGDAIIPVINRLRARFDRLVATKDWHPPDHVSFASSHPGAQVGDIIDANGLQQRLWPPHCVQDTPGAAFPAELDTRLIGHVVLKGSDPKLDSYSGFFDNAHRRDTGLDEYLKSHRVTEVYVCGLATNVCVMATALDALKLGYRTYVIIDACRGIDLEPGDVDRALAAIKKAGVHVIRAAEAMRVS